MLHFPAIEAPTIGDGCAAQVAEGVVWLRMPIGGNLAAINVWALADGDGWTVIDTGLHAPDTVQAWQKALAGPLASGVHRAIVTHQHPDHAGMAGWLAAHHGTALTMPPLEYYMLSVLMHDLTHGQPPELRAFYRAAGWTEAQCDKVLAGFAGYRKMVAPLPGQFRPLAAGQTVTIGPRRWDVLIGRGHAPQHALLYCEADRLLVSGDQILPEISSNVSVHPREPEDDPLRHWLESLAAIRRQLPEDTLVLPAHGRPFRGLHARIDALIASHESGLLRLQEWLTGEHRAVDLFGALFRKPITSATLPMATGECLAHLACLHGRGQATRRRDEAGVIWWSARA